MSKTLNEKLRDSALAHLIDLQRYSNGEVRQMLEALRKADVALFNALNSALLKLDPNSFTVRRLNALLAGVWTANEAAYRQMATNTMASLKELTTFEIKHQEFLFNKFLPENVDLKLAVPLAANVWGAIQARPFQGRLLSEWFDSLSRQRQLRITDAIRGGYVRGETVQEMMNALRGTKAQNYANGILSIDRRHAEAVVRTAIAGTAAQARDAVYAENADIIDSIQWLSTLDSRTTQTCQVRDGLLYTVEDHDPIGHNIDWDEGPGEIHWSCRSMSVPVVAAAQKLGLSLPAVERAAMNGVVPGNVTFGEWIETQPEDVQDAALGATRGQLLRDGKATFDRFFNNAGDMISLDDLQGKLQ